MYAPLGDMVVAVEEHAVVHGEGEMGGGGGGWGGMDGGDGRQ